MDINAETVIGGQLASGERLLWSGHPIQGIVFRLADAFMIPFSFLWGGFAFFWEYSVISAGRAPVFLLLCGIPLVAVALHFIFGRFLVDARQRANTSYGVTNQRVILVSGLFRRKITSLNLRSLSNLSLDERSNGSGIISFGTSSFPSFLTGGIAWPGIPSAGPTLELAANARAVFELIRRAQGPAT